MRRQRSELPEHAATLTLSRPGACVLTIAHYHIRAQRARSMFRSTRTATTTLLFTGAWFDIDFSVPNKSTMYKVAHRVSLSFCDIDARNEKAPVADVRSPEHALMA